MTNELLKLYTERTFIKKSCDRQAPNVQAAIITAASKMAQVSELVSEDDTLHVLVEAYNVTQSPEVGEMLDMAPQFVQDAIGYSVDFNDAGVARSAYDADKETYDAYYQKVSLKSQEMKKNEEKKNSI